MFYKNLFVKFIVKASIPSVCIALLSLICTYTISNVFGDAMSSGTYRIESDSVNFGGVRSTSGSYTREDTAGEVATGELGSETFNLHAGYQQMHSIYIAVTSASDVTMSPSIGGVTGGTSNGSTAFTVTTDGAAGYTTTIKASSSPAMQSPFDTVADYTPAGADPDFTFSVGATAAEFGFTPEGTDIATRFKDNGASCNTGSGDTTDACWAPLTTSDQTILTRTSANHTAGTLTTLKFRLTSGSAHILTNGTYVATTTITVLPL